MKLDNSHNVKNEENTVSENTIKITFNTDFESIRFNTFNNSLETINKILNQINNQFNISNNSNWDFEFRISNINKCCIEIISLIQPIVPAISSFLTNENIEIVKSFGTILVDIFKLKNIYKKNEIPQNVVNGEVQNNIINNNGQIIINQNTFNICNSSTTKESLSKFYATLNSDEEIQSFILEDSMSCSKIENKRIDFKKLTEYCNNQAIDSITINGIITSLRSNNPDGSVNSVTIEGFINNDKSKVVAKYKSNQYKNLIDAHKNKKLISLSGIGIKQKSQYKINEG